MLDVWNRSINLHVERLKVCVRFLEYYFSAKMHRLRVLTCFCCTDFDYLDVPGS